MCNVNLLDDKILVYHATEHLNNNISSTIKQNTKMDHWRSWRQIICFSRKISIWMWTCKWKLNKWCTKIILQYVCYIRPEITRRCADKYTEILFNYYSLRIVFIFIMCRCGSSYDLTLLSPMTPTLAKQKAVSILGF